MVLDEPNGSGRIVTPPPLPAHHGKPPAPIDSGERIAVLDVLRGFALLGILIANMVWFSQPIDADWNRGAFWFSGVDKAADWLSVLLIEGKFYPLFSFLFGIGFALRMECAAERGQDFARTLRRRLFSLMGIGFAHGILLWDGDVLFAYAVCGFLLLLFRNRKPLTIAVWAAICILLPALLIVLLGLVLMALSGNAEFADVMGEFRAEQMESAKEISRAYLSGGYADAVAYRLGEWPFTFFSNALFLPAVLGLFLVGLLAGRSRIITGAEMRAGLLKRILIVCGALGLLGNFAGAQMVIGGTADRDFGRLLIGNGIMVIFGPLLTAAYVSGIVLLARRGAFSRIIAPVASAGRMALTNYLAQSWIATTVFYGYGLGMAGNVGRLGTIAMAIFIFAAQVCFSVWWLKRFRFGPAEWVWRSITYGKRQPMRLPASERPESGP